MSALRLSEGDHRQAMAWLDRVIRDGCPPAALHELVDRQAHVALSDALLGERDQRHRGDRLEVERDNARAELARLRNGIAGLDQDGAP